MILQQQQQEQWWRHTMISPASAAASFFSISPCFPITIEMCECAPRKINRIIYAWTKVDPLRNWKINVYLLLLRISAHKWNLKQTDTHFAV